MVTAPAASRAGARLEISAVAAVAAAVAIFLLASAANLDRVPPFVPSGLAVLLALSVVRPDAGLAAAAALIPLSQWIVQAAGLEAFRLAEALALATLAGALIRLAYGSGRRPPAEPALPAGIGPAAAVFVAVAAASGAVEIGLQYAGYSSLRSSAADFATLAATNYLYDDQSVAPGLVDAARLIEGVALVLVILAWGRRVPALARRLAVATLAGAVAAGAVNLTAMATAVLTDERSGAALLSYLGGSRLAAHISDVNATGSYFLMTTLVGVGLTFARRGARTLAAAATLAAGAAFWLAGSRAALFTAACAGYAAAASRLVARRPDRWRLAAAGVVLAAFITVPLAIFAVYPGRIVETIEKLDMDVARLGATRAVYDAGAWAVVNRADFVVTSLRMWATEPVFGVGAGRYLPLSSQFMPPVLLAHYSGGENAHNNFLQVAAEFGAAGAAALVWLLGVAGLHAWRAVRARRSGDPLLVGASYGAAAFLATCLVGHPLLVPETAYPFWIVLGFLLLLARGRPPSAAGHRRRQAVVTAAVLAVAASAPFRVDAERRGLAFDATPSASDATRSGLFDWETDHKGGRRFRWAGCCSAFLIPAGARGVNVPLRALHAGRGEGAVTVDVAVGGRHVRRVPLLDSRWVEIPLGLAAPDPGREHHRIELRVMPPWSPHARRDSDDRTLGVQIGELSFEPIREAGKR